MSNRPLHLISQKLREQFCPVRLLLVSRAGGDQGRAGAVQVAVRHRPLPARRAILDVIGCLLTNRCQIEKLLFYG